MTTCTHECFVMTAGSQRFLSFIYIYVLLVVSGREAKEMCFLYICVRYVYIQTTVHNVHTAVLCNVHEVTKKKKGGRSPVHCVKRIEDKLLPERNPYQKYRKSPEVLWVKSSQRIMYLENCTYCVHSSQCPALYIYFQKIYTISLYIYAATLKGTHGWHSNSDLPKSGLLIRWSKGYMCISNMQFFHTFECSRRWIYICFLD